MRILSANRKTTNRQRGTAVLVVFMLLAVMALLIVCNNRILRSLKEELHFVERQQIKKLSSRISLTNSLAVSKEAVKTNQ